MHKPRKFVDIVIPFNNEYRNLQILLPKILKVIKKIKFLKFRLVFVDDGSVDGGHIIIGKFKKQYKHIFLLKNKKNFGQTHCYVNYFKRFKMDYFIRMDADNQDNPKYLLQISKFISEDYDLILSLSTEHGLTENVKKLLFLDEFNFEKNAETPFLKAIYNEYTDIIRIFLLHRNKETNDYLKSNKYARKKVDFILLKYSIESF